MREHEGQQEDESLHTNALEKLLLALLLASAYGFTDKQRQWFKRRDKECVLKGKDNIVCSRPDKDEIDHVTPQGVAREAIGITEEQTDTPLNGARLCVNHHRGHPNSKHPDAQQASWNYKKDRKSFEKLRPERNAKLKKGEMYWDDRNGDQLAVEARRRTLEYSLKHPQDKFPQKNGVK